MPVPAASARYLVADIGGTNARFAVGEARPDGALQLRDVQVWATQTLGQGADLAGRLNDRFDLAEVRYAVFGMAGPVSADHGQLTNGPLRLDAAALTAALERRVELCNDFQVLAHGLPSFAQLVRIGGAATPPGADQPRAVIGAGSGLGMALCLPPPADAPQELWQVLPSEGGHADLPSTSPLEAEVLALLQARFEHVCWETVLSGPGLVRLYECVATLWGEQTPPAPVTADWITSAAVDAQHPPCHQALELFLGWLGAAAGNFALTTCAFGGVYLGGGIAPRLAPQLLHGPFRRRFEARGSLSGLLTDVPVYLILDDSPGLLGALSYAHARASALAR